MSEKNRRSIGRRHCSYVAHLPALTMPTCRRKRLPTTAKKRKHHEK
nr:MAG TPA: hypothetical protein [Caudoviricetes sp.]